MVVPVNIQGKQMAVSAKCQGNDMIVTGDLSSSDCIKCLSVVEGKEKIVGEGASCCASCLSIGGIDSLLIKLEALHMELIKYIGQLKICKCCP